MTDEKLIEYCKKEGFVGGFRTSAKANIGIEEAFRYLTGRVRYNLLSLESLAAYLLQKRTHFEFSN